MTTYLRFGLRVLIWGLVLAFSHYFSTALNPFLGLLIFLFTLLAVVVQLVLLRKRGLVYLGLFLLSAVALAYAFLLIDGLLFQHPRRYYSIQ